ADGYRRGDSGGVRFFFWPTTSHPDVDVHGAVQRLADLSPGLRYPLVLQVLPRLRRGLLHLGCVGFSRPSRTGRSLAQIVKLGGKLQLRRGHTCSAFPLPPPPLSPAPFFLPTPLHYSLTSL